MVRRNIPRLRFVPVIALSFILAGCGGGGSATTPGSSPPPPPPPSNPAPGIVSLSPDSANAGGASFTLTINGYNFLSSSSVHWNGSSRTTTYVSSTQLQAQITASDIANSGSEAVSVTNPSPGGGNSGSAEFIVIPTSNPAPSLTAGDPNGVNAGSPGFILTLRGSNFTSSSAIQWNGTTIATTYLSETHLEAQIPASYVADSGFAEIVVSTPGPGGGVSAPLFFAINYQPLVVSQLSNDIIWDDTHQLMYLSVPSLASSNGNSIVALNPMTGVVESSQFAGSEPNVLAISDDNQFLYAGVDGASSVQCFTLPGLVPDIHHTLEPDASKGTYSTMDMQVAPSRPHTTAISRGNFGFSAIGGMVIYDDDTQRPNISDTPGLLYDSLQWGSDTAIYAINNEINSFDFYVLSVNSNGVTLSKDYQKEFSTFYVRMHYDKGTGYVYTDDGSVINPANGQHVGAFQAAGYMVTDFNLNRAFFFGQTAFQFGTNSYTIEYFDLRTFVPIAEIVVTNVQGFPLRFIRWGSNGLAFNDDAGYVYLINSSFVGADNKQSKTPPKRLEPVSNRWTKPQSRSQRLIRTGARLNRAHSRRQFGPQDANPAPTITALSPSYVVLGGVGQDGFTLTVTGNNFVSLSNVEWNGSLRLTEFVSSTELQAQIDFVDVQNAGSASITVMTPSPGGGTSNSLPFTIVDQNVTPAPDILALYPNNVAAGSAGFTLEVDGHTFYTPSSVVEWNGSPRPTSLTNPGQLKAQITAADVAFVGYAQVTVFTPGPGGGRSNVAEFQILYQPTVINQTTNDMLWDPLNQVFYVSIPSSAKTNANQVCALDPIGLTITNCQPGNEPNVLAISDDSQFLYVGMDGNSLVQRYILPTLTPDISYSLGSEPGTGDPYFALDLQVAPGFPHTTAVSKGIVNRSPEAIGGITIYDDSTPRPNSAPGWDAGHLYDSLQWGPVATQLYAANTEDTYDFFTLSVNSSGVMLDQDYPNVFWNPGRIHYNTANGLIYSDDGFHAIDPSTGLPPGMFEVGGGWPMAPDSTLGVNFILAQYVWQQQTNYTVDLFDITHYLPVNRVPFPTTAQLGINPPRRFIRWNSDGLALNFKGDKVYLLSGSFIGGNRGSRSKTRLKSIR